MHDVPSVAPGLQMLSRAPSPQRTPVLFQAGTSPAGRAFAARNAECVFVQATTPPRTAAAVADIRRLAAERGRDPRGVKLMAGLTVFVGETEADAKRYESEFDAMQTDEIVASLYAGNTGIDLLALDPDKTLHQVLEQGGPVGQMGTSNIERFLGENAPTVREILDQLRGRGTRGFRVVGDPVQVADAIERDAMDELREELGRFGLELRDHQRRRASDQLDVRLDLAGGEVSHDRTAAVASWQAFTETSSSPA